MLSKENLLKKVVNFKGFYELMENLPKKGCIIF
jgi:hypothetical protein